MTTVSLGSLAVDTKDDRLGVVMAREGGVYQLRPLRGGVEWDALPENLRTATAADKRHADGEGWLP